jgi:radical SAM superfamily enzyme YgiQ (UPF0313 family)
VASQRDIIRQRLARERGTLFREAPTGVALLYPSPYTVGMSSLGYQVMYRCINGRPDTAAARAFLPDDVAEAKRVREPLLTYETQRPVGDHPIVATSVAYEGELGGLIESLALSGIPPLREERAGGRYPFVLAGGPLTFSNPVPLAPYVDAVVVGEAEEVIHRVLDVLVEGGDHDRLCSRASRPSTTCGCPPSTAKTSPPSPRPTTTCCPRGRKSSPPTPSCRTCFSSRPSAAAPAGASTA